MELSDTSMTYVSTSVFVLVASQSIEVVTNYAVLVNSTYCIV